MPKYYGFKVCDHILYFTTHCTVEAMHVHAGNEEMNERIAAKFFVKADGDSVLQKVGDLKPRQVVGIQQFTKENYRYLVLAEEGNLVKAPLSEIEMLLNIVA